MTATEVYENTCKSFVFSTLNQFRNRQVESSTLSLGSTHCIVVPPATPWLQSDFCCQGAGLKANIL